MSKKNKKVWPNYLGELSKMPGKANVDLHTHSIFSDGFHRIDYLIGTAKNIDSFTGRPNAEVLAISDHNTFDGIIDYLNLFKLPLDLPQYDCKGTIVIPAVEITCRVGGVLDNIPMITDKNAVDIRASVGSDSVEQYFFIKNQKNNSTKVHLLVYGADLRPTSPLVQAMKLKKENDRIVDLGLIAGTAHKLGISKIIDLQSILQYQQDLQINDTPVSSFAYRDAIKFFTSDLVSDILKKNNNKSYRSAKHIVKALREDKKKEKKGSTLEDIINAVKLPNRLDLTTEEVIKLAHASGGVVVMAHPKTNLNRTNYKAEVLDVLYTQGIDGYELGNASENSELLDTIMHSKSRCVDFGVADRDLFLTAGSDLHSLGISELARSAGKKLTRDMISGLFEYLDELYKARQMGNISLNDSKIDMTEAMEIVENITNRKKACEKGVHGIGDLRRTINSMYRGKSLSSKVSNIAKEPKEPYTNNSYKESRQLAASQDCIVTKEEEQRLLLKQAQREKRKRVVFSDDSNVHMVPFDRSKPISSIMFDPEREEYVLYSARNIAYGFKDGLRYDEVDGIAKTITKEEYHRLIFFINENNSERER